MTEVKIGRVSRHALSLVLVRNSFRDEETRGVSAVFLVSEFIEELTCRLLPEEH